MKKITKLLFPILIIFIFFACNEYNSIDQTVEERTTTQIKGIKSNLTAIIQPSFNLSGYATQGAGTTGGASGITVNVNNYTDLKAHLESTDAKTVVVSGTIYNGTKGGIIFIKPNKTLLGTGNNTLLNGIGLAITGTNNIIIRNIKITMQGITDKTDTLVYDPDGDEGRPQIKVNDGDCISIYGTNSNIWIDHCELYNANPYVQTNKDLYDGLIDIKDNSTYITVSWCYFHDHHKVHLIGSSDTNNFDRRITFHHNYYRNVISRLPMYRFGKGHIYNNYFTAVGSGAIDCRMGSCVKVERNVFEKVKSPLVRTGTTLGNYQINGNRTSGITGTAFPTSSTCTHTPPYAFTLDDINIVKSECVNKSGVGKI